MYLNDKYGDGRRVAITMELHEQLQRLTNLEVYASSLIDTKDAMYFLGRRGTEKFVGSVGEGNLVGQKVGELDNKPIIVGPTDHANACAIRNALPWTAPGLVGLKKSIGMGDRLGVATPGHIRAVRGSGLTVLLAQQSIREMTRTGRSPNDVIDSTTWGVLQEGFGDGFGSDADHLHTFEDVDSTVEAGFTMFTIDPGQYVDDAAETDDYSILKEKASSIDLSALETTLSDISSRYVGKTFDLGEIAISFDEGTFLRTFVKYARAVGHIVKMYRHLLTVAHKPFEVEVSIDETDSPTTPADHFFIVTEMKRLGVEWIAIAPRFVGRFEKGVDYIGDLDLFRASFAEHVRVMKAMGPYKISIHSGSDKFSIYPIAAELAGEYLHVKTAGTSYLEALRVIAAVEPDLFREIFDFALQRYETDKATYHVSANIEKIPPIDTITNDRLPGLIDDFNTRQVLHVTYGSVLTAQDGEKFRSKLLTTLKQHEELHYANLEKHLRRHVKGLIGKDISAL